MSIDLNWDTLTTGPDGLELAERIRDFIHSKFQAVPLPRFIKSVTVHDFEFGSIAPELELKDITDPLPDFYEEEEESDDEESGSGSGSGGGSSSRNSRDEYREQVPVAPEQPVDGRRPYPGGHRHELSGSSMFSNTTVRPTTSASTVTHSGGVPGGTSNLLHHFHSHLTPGWSGAQTPLAAMAGAHLGGGGGGGSGGGGNLSAGSPSGPSGTYFGGGTDQPRPRHNRNPSRSSSISMGGGGGGGPDSALAAAAAAAAAAVPTTSSSSYSSATNPALLRPILREKHSVSTLAPTSAGIPSRPPTRDGAMPGLSGSGGGFGGGGNAAAEEDKDAAGRGARRAAATAAAEAAGAAGTAEPEGLEESRLPHAQRPHEPRAEDMQAVFRIRYAGDIKLLLTADILLDYPMPSFVGIPVRLSITGLTFDGVGVLAYIRRRIHFCFLGPEDALAAVGDDDDDADDEVDESDEGGDHGAATASAARPTTLRGAGAGVGAGVAAGHSAGQAATPAPAKPRTRVGGLLQEVRVESEIGQRQGGKQSLKNVGKVERFVLEQVRRIFEEEFVYPSFWTFLV